MIIIFHLKVSSQNLQQLNILIFIFMSEHQSSRTTQSLEYELIPTSDPIQQPNLDKIILNQSRALNHHHNHYSYPTTPYQKQYESTQKLSTPFQTQRQLEPAMIANQFRQMRKIIQQQNQRIQQLEELLTKERYQHNLQKLANQVYTNLFNDLINTFQSEKAPSIAYNKEKQIESNIQANKKNNIMDSKNKGANIRSELYKAKAKIEKLRQQLLMHSQNNIYTLFNSHLVLDNNIMTKHILQLNKQVQNLKSALERVKEQQKELGNSMQIIRKKQVNNSKNDRNNKLQEIQKGYEKLSQGYNGMRTILDKVNEDQSVVKEYIEKLRQDITQTLQIQKEELKAIKISSANNQAIVELQKKFLALIQAFNTPQALNRELTNSIDLNNLENYNEQIRYLNEKIRENQQQLMKEKQEKQKLQDKIQQIQKNGLISSTEANGRLNKLESLLKQKKNRIRQLENTIIDHLEVKSKNNYSSRQNSLENSGNFENNKDNTPQQEHRNRIQQVSQTKIFKKNKSQPFLEQHFSQKFESVEFERLESRIKQTKQSESQESKQASAISKSSSKKSSSICFRKVA